MCMKSSRAIHFVGARRSLRYLVAVIGPRPEALGLVLGDPGQPLADVPAAGVEPIEVLVRPGEGLLDDVLHIGPLEPEVSDVAEQECEVLLEKQEEVCPHFGRGPGALVGPRLWRSSAESGGLRWLGARSALVGALGGRELTGISAAEDAKRRAGSGAVLIRSSHAGGLGVARRHVHEIDMGPIFFCSKADDCWHSHRGASWPRP